MALTVEGALQYATQLINQLEGPYKWYVIGAAVLVLTALLTRFIFHTLKWFLLVIIAGVIALAGLWLLSRLSGLV